MPKGRMVSMGFSWTLWHSPNISMSGQTNVKQTIVMHNQKSKRAHLGVCLILQPAGPNLWSSGERGPHMGPGLPGSTIQEALVLAVITAPACSVMISPY